MDIAANGFAPRGASELKLCRAATRSMLFLVHPTRGEEEDILCALV